MKSLFNKYKWLRIVIGIVLLLAGVLTVILSIKNIAAVELIISIMIAVICFIYALLLIVTSLVRNTRTPFPFEIFIGGIFIGIGITILLPGVFSSVTLLIVYLVACGVLALGGLALIKSIIIICYKDPIINWLIMLICSLIAITGGILLLVYQGSVFSSVNIILGVGIGLLGIAEIVYGIVKIAKKK